MQVALYTRAHRAAAGAATRLASAETVKGCRRGTDSASGPLCAAVGIILVIVASLGGHSVARAGTVIIDAAAAYPEAPLWRDGKLYYVEYAGPGIKVWDGRHFSQFWTGVHCGPAGLAPFGPDHLLVACYDANTLVEVDLNGKTIGTIDRDVAGHEFVGPNDFAADDAGGLYISASGVYDVKAPINGTVLYRSRQGIMRVVADTLHYPNGLAVSRDGKTLLVAEDLAGRILAFTIRADGTLGARSVWARLRDLAPPTLHDDAYNGPDGLKLGPDGNYYIAQNGSGRVLVVSESRKLVKMISVPTRYVTNVNFGGDGAHSLFITGVFDASKAPYRGAVYRWTSPPTGGYAVPPSAASKAAINGPSFGGLASKVGLMPYDASAREHTGPIDATTRLPN